jgi:hypothetical protein
MRPRPGDHRCAWHTHCCHHERERSAIEKARIHPSESGKRFLLGFPLIQEKKLEKPPLNVDSSEAIRQPAIFANAAQRKGHDRMISTAGDTSGEHRK